MTTRTAVARQVPVLTLALLATPMSLSANSATTVIPALARELGTTAADATWAATAFGWGAVIGTPLTAALLRSRGPRLAVLISTILVLSGTVLVALASNLPLLLAGRATQAAGGGGLYALAITLARTPQRTGIVTAGVGLVGAFGPLAGSALSTISWRLALGLSVIAVLAVPTVVRRVPSRQAAGSETPTDGTGVWLVLAAASALVLTPRFPLPALVVAAAIGVLLAGHIRRQPEGFVPRPVLRTSVFRLATAVVGALSISYFALLYTLPRLLERTWPSGRIGLTILVALAAGSVLSLVMARYTARLGQPVMRTVLAVAGGLAVAMATLAPWPAAQASAIALAVFAATAGMAWYAGEIREAVPEVHRPSALGLFTLTYLLGGAFGPALATRLIG